MSEWINIEPDSVPAEIEMLTSKISEIRPQTRNWSFIRNLHRMLVNYRNVPCILMDGTCMAKIYEHVSSSTNEMGGLLIGRVFSLPAISKHGYDFATIITNSVSSTKYRNSSVSVWMDPEVWNSAHEIAREGENVIGWYHSHPGIGVFFSGTDRMTQQNFFSHGHSLGLVIDPVAKNEKLFFGPMSSETAFTVVKQSELST
jgi:proteasome lid subunit RPN8/RPN11